MARTTEPFTAWNGIDEPIPKTHANLTRRSWVETVSQFHFRHGDSSRTSSIETIDYSQLSAMHARVETPKTFESGNRFLYSVLVLVGELIFCPSRLGNLISTEIALVTRTLGFSLR